MKKEKQQLPNGELNVVRIDCTKKGFILPGNEQELDNRINELFVKYICAGIEKSEDEMPDYVKVCREVFKNGYKAGHNDAICRITGIDWDKMSDKMIIMSNKEQN